MKHKIVIKEQKNPTIPITVILCSTILGIFAIIGVAFGRMGLQNAFIICGISFIIFLFSLGGHFTS